MELIQTLKNEHRELVAALKEIQQKGIVSPDGRKVFFVIREKLLAHLKHEDEEFYPRLRKAAERDKSLNELLNVFARDMKQITDTAQNFFKKYSKESTGVEFAGDLGKLFVMLGNRISREENILFAAFLKAAG